MHTRNWHVYDIQRSDWLNRERNEKQLTLGHLSYILHPKQQSSYDDIRANVTCKNEAPIHFYNMPVNHTYYIM